MLIPVLGFFLLLSVDGETRMGTLFSRASSGNLGEFLSNDASAAVRWIGWMSIPEIIYSHPFGVGLVNPYQDRAVWEIVNGYINRLSPSASMYSYVSESIYAGGVNESCRHIGRMGVIYFICVFPVLGIFAKANRVGKCIFLITISPVLMSTPIPHPFIWAGLAWAEYFSRNKMPTSASVLK